jgi:NADH dehydrogenase
MILVTGGTGFLGRVLIKHLVSEGEKVRTLIRPSKKSPHLPVGVPVEVTVCSLKDERGLRAALKGVQVVIHLAGTEEQGSKADLLSVDIQGTQALVHAARDARVDRMMYVSHLGADRASAYPVLKAKAIAENFIQQSGMDYTIFRSAVLYGQEDHFSTRIAALLKAMPGLFFLPGEGTSVLQPLWVEDLATCMTWSLVKESTRNQVYSVGGEEYISFREIVRTIMQITRIKSRLISISPAYLRGLTILSETLFHRFPLSIFWMDYLATDRTCPVDTLPRVFGLLPGRFSKHLEYLKTENRYTSITKSEYPS